MNSGRRGKQSRTCCGRLVVVTICSVLFLFVILEDLQENYNFYVEKYLQPSSKMFICVQQTGHLETDLYSFAFGFGLAKANDRHIAIKKGSVIQYYFRLPSAKLLKNVDVCNIFEKREIPQNLAFNRSLISLDEWTHYYYVNGSGFVSVKYFDAYKTKLLEELSFVDASAQSVKDAKLAIHGDSYAKFNNVKEVVIYVANSTSLKASFGLNYIDSLRKYLAFAMNHFTFRFQNVRFLVLLQSDDFTIGVDSSSNASITYLIKNNNFKSLTRRSKLDFLTSCDHVITTGAADQYGWWVGYLSRGEVVYPVIRSKDTCSGKLCEIPQDDLYPHTWIGLTFD